MPTSIPENVLLRVFNGSEWIPYYTKTIAEIVGYEDTNVKNQLDLLVASSKDSDAIIVEGTSGTLTTSQVDFLTNGYSHIIIHKNNNKLYELHLCLIDGNDRKYGTMIQGQEYRVDVNTSTRAWTLVISQFLTSEALTNHINDTDVHIQTGERADWNNKVSAELDSVNPETLILSVTTD